MPKTSKFKAILFKTAKEVSPIMSINDIDKLFPDASYDGYKSALRRMQNTGDAILAWKYIYIIKPKEYFGDVIVPLREYVDVITHNMNKDYYVSLRGAMAEYLPSCPKSDYYDIIIKTSGMAGVYGSTTPAAYFVNSARIPTPYIIDKETKYGTFKLATPELLAIDLVTYPNVTGSLQASVDALKALSSKLNFRRLKEDIFEYRTAANIQRLGYIIENVLGMPAKAKPLHDMLDKRYNKVYTRNSLASALPGRLNIDKRWQLDVNIELKG